MKYRIAVPLIVLAVLLGRASVAKAQCHEFYYRYTLACGETRFVNVMHTNPFNWFVFTLGPNTGDTATFTAWMPYGNESLQLEVREAGCGDLLAQGGGLSTQSATICNFQPPPSTPYELIVVLQGYIFAVKMICSEGPIDCGAVPVQETTWGSIKALYR